MKKIMTKTDMKGIHGGGRLKQRIAEHLRASRAVVSMSTGGVSKCSTPFVAIGGIVAAAVELSRGTTFTPSIECSFQYDYNGD